MEVIRNLIVIGDSASGKTTLVNALREPKYSEELIVPPRYVTRPARLRDDTTENHYLKEDAFKNAVEAQLIRPYWGRDFPGGIRQYYGFQTIDRQDPRVKVLSANSALPNDPNSSVEELYEDSLVVVASADEVVRAERLKKRSPDITGVELLWRLRGVEVDLSDFAFNPVHIDTTSMSVEEGKLAMQAIVERLI